MHITLDAGADAPAAARHEMARLRSRLGGRFEDALVVVTELVTNSVVHGPAGGAIDVITTVTGRWVRIEVRDDGPCFQGTGRDGFGLHIVSSIATRWGVVRQSNCRVWVDIDLAECTTP
jgi:anti-sigma regulatory factor (Ser/Thr protein kinase)